MTTVTEGELGMQEDSASANRLNNRAFTILPRLKEFRFCCGFYAHIRSLTIRRNCDAGAFTLALTDPLLFLNSTFLMRGVLEIDLDLIRRSWIY